MRVSQVTPAALAWFLHLGSKAGNKKNLHEQYFKNFGNAQDREIKNNSLLKTELVENNSICLPQSTKLSTGQLLAYKQVCPECCLKPHVPLVKTSGLSDWVPGMRSGSGLNNNTKCKMDSLYYYFLAKGVTFPNSQYDVGCLWACRQALTCFIPDFLVPFFKSLSMAD